MENNETLQINEAVAELQAKCVARFGSWSPGEKYVMTRLVPRSPELAHPLEECRNRKGGCEMVYSLEGDTKALEDAWPFSNWKPGMDDEVYDVHSRRLFRFGNCKIIRLEGRNILVCEDYLQTGGMACDIEPADRAAGGAPQPFLGEVGQPDGSKTRRMGVVMVLGETYAQDSDSQP